jgi:predicted  nucleic acid-binding Zn-ribbon protein
VTCGASGPILDAEKFNEYQEGNMTVDECHTTFDRAIKFTLVHFKRKIRQPTMEKFMVYAANKYGIISTAVFGYASISANNSFNELYNQIGFQMLMQHKISMNPSFYSWIESPDLRGGGILETYQRRNPQIRVIETIDQDNSEDENDEAETLEQGEPRPSKKRSTSKRARTSNETSGSGAVDEEDQDLEAKLVQAKEDVEHYKGKASRNKKELRKSNDTVDMLTTQLAQSNAEVGTLTTQLEESNAQVGTLTTERDSAVAALALNTQTAAFATEIGDLAAQLEAAKIETATTKTEVDDLKLRIGALNGKVAKLERNARDLEKKLKDSEAEILSLQDQLTLSTEELNKYKEDTDATAPRASISTQLENAAIGALTTVTPQEMPSHYKGYFGRALNKIDGLEAKAVKLEAERAKCSEALKVALCEKVLLEQGSNLKDKLAEIQKLKDENKDLTQKLEEYKKESTTHAETLSNSMAGFQKYAEDVKRLEHFNATVQGAMAGAAPTIGSGHHVLQNINEIMKNRKADEPTKTVDQCKDAAIVSIFDAMHRANENKTKELNKTIRDMKAAFEKERNQALVSGQAYASDMSTAADYQRLYYGELVKEYDGGPPARDESGYYIPIWRQYQNENTELKEKVEDLEGQVTEAETMTRLLNAQKKARIFKQKYKNLVEYMDTCEYEKIDDSVYDYDRNRNNESDDDLRDEPKERLKKYQDPAFPPGCSYKPSSD